MTGNFQLNPVGDLPGGSPDPSFGIYGVLKCTGKVKWYRVMVIYSGVGAIICTLLSYKSSHQGLQKMIVEYTCIPDKLKPF